MSEFRRDELFDRTVLIAEDRQHRPHDYAALGRTLPDELQRTQEHCPFCRGRESQTPPATYQLLDNQGNWLVRVVPNKYPAVQLASPAAPGVHEIIVETPIHVGRTNQIPAGQLLNILETCQRRLRHWRSQGNLTYAALFKNVGALAGASLVHLHSQLLVLKAVPSPVLRELERLREAKNRTGRCAVCTRLAAQLGSAPNTILQSEGYLAFCPPVSLHAYETWIVPTRHESWLEETGSLVELAGLLYDILQRVEKVAGAAGYNLLLMNGPWLPEAGQLYHWRIELRPRLHPLAGLELGSGIHINQVAPERAAGLLKNSA